MEVSSEPSELQLEEALPLLESTPTTLHSLLGSLPPSWLHFKEDTEGWSPYTVLVHFVHNERTNWIPRLRVLLSDEPVRKFAPFQQLPEQSQLTAHNPAELLDKFNRLRAANVSFFRGLALTPSQLDREAEHPVLGTVKLKHLLATWVVHDLNHLHQIAKSLAKRYQSAVGPWRRNLAILDL